MGRRVGHAGRRARRRTAGIILDLKRLDRILEIDETSLTVRAQAGINGGQLEWALNDRGLTLPHYPASANCATLGGYLAPRGSGTISTKYGKAEDLVMSMEVVLPDGTIARTPGVPNHASGPDFMRLFLGSEGTLGVITEATMRITRLPETRLFRAMLFKDVATGLEAGRQLMVQRLDPLVIRMYDEHSTASLVKRVLGLRARGRVHDCRLRRLGRDRRRPGSAGAEDLRGRRARAISGASPANAGGRSATTSTIRRSASTCRRCTAPSRPWPRSAASTRSTTPRRRRSKTASAISACSTSGTSRTGSPGARACTTASCCARPPQDPHEAQALHNRIWDVAVQTSLAHGGMINEHHGVGLKLSRFMAAQYGDAWPLLQSLKRAIDPHGIMNPGKVGFEPDRTA